MDFIYLFIFCVVFFILFICLYFFLKLNVTCWFCIYNLNLILCRPHVGLSRGKGRKKTGVNIIDGTKKADVWSCGREGGEVKEG